MKGCSVTRWANPKTILVATNLHDSPHLVLHAVAQANLSSAHVLLLHVIETVHLSRTSAAGQLDLKLGPTLRSIQDELNQIVKQFQWEGILCEPITLEGTPSEQIEAVVNDRDVDRVIAGTRSAGALERLLEGSVVEDLLHTVDVPICILGPHVRPQIHPKQKPGSILYATSFHHESQMAAQLAIELASLHRSRLTFLHVIPKRHPSEEVELRILTERQGALVNLFQGVNTHLCLPVARVREGDPAEEILAEAADLSADLIILGATGASRISRLLATGVVHKVISEARGPVMTIRGAQAVPFGQGQ